LIGAALLAAAALGAPGVGTDRPVVTSVERADARGVESRPVGTRYLRPGETVALTVVLVSPDGLDCHAPPDGTDGVRFDGRACRPLSPEMEARLRWYEARAEARDYDNFKRCHGRPRADCADPIAYRFDEIPAWRGRARVEAGAAAGLGSHRYVVTLGAAPAPLPAGAAVAALPEIVVRRDDSYAGYLTEMIGAPFVLWPAADEVDGRRGADCVALVVYGQRRLGRQVPYVSPTGLKKLTTRIAAGRFPRDPAPGSRTRPPSIPIRAGDVVHFGFQTAVVVEDRPPLGRLTEDDVVIHSYHGLAEEIPLGRVPYAHFPFEVRRWRR
jgi:hypothetical protein